MDSNVNKETLPEAGEREGFGIYKRPRTADRPQQRKGEQIGGGWFVFRRGEKGGRVYITDMPYEHPNQKSAMDEADRLSKKHPGQKYQVFGGGMIYSV